MAPVRNAKLEQQRRIASLIVGASTILIALMIAIIALQVPMLNDARRQEKYAELPLRAATVIKKLLIEQRIACDFVSRPFDGETDTVRQMPLVKAQQDTIAEINALFQHYSDVFAGDSAEDTANPSLVFPYAGVVEVQAAALKRSQTPGQISLYYQIAKQRAVQLLLGAASRSSAPRHSASIAAVLTSNLLFAESGERIALTAALRHSHLSEESLSQSLELSNLLQYESSLYLGIVGEDATAVSLVRAVQSSSRYTVNVLRSLIQFPKTWVSYIEPADVTSDDLAEGLPIVLQAFIDRQQYLLSKTHSPTLQYGISIGLASGVIVIALIAICVSVRRLVLTTLAKEADLEQAVYVEALARSYDRVVRFLTSIVRLDLGNMTPVEGKAVQPTEREVYALEQPVKNVLRLLNPAIPRWRALLGAKGDLGIGEAIPAVPRELVGVPTTILLVDLSAYHIKPTGETIKSYPSVMCTLLQGISSIVESAGGVVHDVSANRVVIGWNLSVPNIDHEMSACAVALAVQRAHSTENLPLRMSISTGQVLAGVVGSDTYRPFIVLGKPLALAGHLLRVAQMHGVGICMDTITFASLDSQQFLTCPLEVLSVGDEPSDQVTVHELLCVSSKGLRDGRLLLWNKAFDAWAVGDYSQALPLLKEYKRMYGGSKSLHRLAALCLLRKSVTTVGDLNESIL